MSASTDDLMVLRAYARRQGVSLATVLREAVAQEAARIRAQTPPRYGFGASGGQTSIAELLEAHPDEPFEAHPFRS